MCVLNLNVNVAKLLSHYTSCRNPSLITVSSGTQKALWKICRTENMLLKNTQSMRLVNLHTLITHDIWKFWQFDNLISILTIQFTFWQFDWRLDNLIDISTIWLTFRQFDWHFDNSRQIYADLNRSRQIFLHLTCWHLTLLTFYIVDI